MTWVSFTCELKDMITAINMELNHFFTCLFVIVFLSHYGLGNKMFVFELVALEEEIVSQSPIKATGQSDG